MYEFAIPPEFHINTAADPRALFSLAIGIVGDAAAEAVSARRHELGRATPSDAVRFAATFFDSFIDARLDDRVRAEFTLLAACAYYLADLPGNSRLLVSRIEPPAFDGARSLDWLVYRLLRSELETDLDDFARDPSMAEVLDALAAYLVGEGGPEALFQSVDGMRRDAYDDGQARAVLYADLVGAIIRKKIENSSRNQLPAASDLPLDQWKPTLAKPSFVSELWPAQRRICDAGILRGGSAVIQMPTSAGKTRATELIIRNAFLADRTALAVIVSPFRALCHDIRGDLVKAFAGENVGVNEATDAFQFDLSFDEFLGRKTVLILTPEKLLYLLRRTPELADQIGLIIYDEGHQFDSPARGATYELLLTSLKLLLHPATQTVLISAVIANAAEVADWLVGDLEAVVRGDDLAPTTRSVAFANWATALGQLRYVSPVDPDDLEFFVPRVIESRPLARLGRERNIRRFPERDSGTSIGLYLGLKLVRNGSVAVFCGRKDTAANLCETAVDLYRREYPDPPPLEVSDQPEAAAISRLFALNIGEAASATHAAAIGVFPHHANVPHGLRLCVEHAMKEGLAKLVVCTSTLAQGVNLPIRYLIVTGVYQGAERILVRDFHNLIGRAGRAGMHTEGSVIFAQNEIYDGRLAFGTRWRWDTARALLNPANSEPSASSLLLMFAPFSYGRPTRHIILDVATAHTLVFDEHPQVEQLVAAAAAAHPAADMRAFERYVQTRVRIVQSIAAFILAHLDFNAASFADDAEILCTNTLAHHLADDDQRAALKALFRNIAVLTAEQAPTEELRTSIRRSALSPTSVRSLRAWLLQNVAQLQDAMAAESLFDALSGQVLSYSTNDALLSLSEPDEVVPLAGHWMGGQSFTELHGYLRGKDIRLGTRRPKVEDIVGICEGGFGYDSAMLFSTVADLLEPIDADLSDGVGVLHKRLKYGLPTRASIAFFEAGFADRVLAQELAQAFPHVTDRATAVLAVRGTADGAAAIIATYPSYFKAVLAELAA
jgi:hypothetical protein